MTKILQDFRIESSRTLPSGSCLMTLSTADGAPLPEILPGQFVEIKVDHAASAMLRRPISVCDVRDGRLVLFIKPVGDGTRTLTSQPEGSSVNILLPLGHGFSLDVTPGESVLLVGGGVGAAPLVMLARQLAARGADVTVALGGRTATDLQELPALYEGETEVALSTDDGSLGAKGVVTLNPVFSRAYSRIYCCGPTPMMRAVARIAAERGTWCEVSLENHMACGLGACLCCVEETSDKGNVCVCTEGPVFNINRLQSWL